MLYSDELIKKDQTWISKISQDQLLLNEWLVPNLTKEDKIFFIGTGNSSLAKECADIVNWIDGITVIHSEFDFAKSLNLKNYNVYLFDKYSNDILTLDKKYSYILDINLTSYAKNEINFINMINNYFSLLENNGKILSTLIGLDYIYEGSNCNITSIEQLTTSLNKNAKVPFEIKMETNLIFSISKKMKKITFVIPSRNNLDFLKIAYKSIRNLKTQHEVLILDDYSIDGTHEWLSSLNDENLIHYRNEGPERIGIVGMFDKGIEMAKTEIIFAFHADMIAGPNLDLNILKHLKPQTIVCATRIEPPLHGPGPEKIIQNWGNEAEEIDFNTIINGISFLEKENENKTTKGIFAPWCMYKSDYLKIGGHDELFAPQSKEDSDLFNRFVLNGYELIQSWDGLVYHFTSRGSRFNKYSGGAAGKDSEEWKFTTNKNGRNFIRKWGHFVKHDKFMYPIIPHKFDIGFNIKNSNELALYHLEPWCNTIKVDCEYGNYIESEQKNTLINLSKKITKEDLKNNIIIDIDISSFDNNKFAVIQNISEVITNINALGSYQVEGLNIAIHSLETYEKDFIK